MGLASKNTVGHLVILDRPGPVGQVLAVEDWAEARRTVPGQNSICLVREDLTNPDVAPVDFMVVGLELDRAFGRQRQLAVPVILESGVINDQLVVEVDSRPLANLDDPERIPLIDWPVGSCERILARRAAVLFQSPPEPLSAPIRA